MHPVRPFERLESEGKTSEPLTCMANEEVHRGVCSPIRRKAHAVTLVHGARPGVGVHVAIPGGIHLQRHHMS